MRTNLGSSLSKIPESKYTESFTMKSRRHGRLPLWATAGGIVVFAYDVAREGQDKSPANMKL